MAGVTHTLDSSLAIRWVRLCRAACQLSVYCVHVLSEVAILTRLRKSSVLLNLEDTNGSEDYAPSLANQAVDPALPAPAYPEHEAEPMTGRHDD